MKRFNLLLWSIAAAAMVLLALSGPDDVQAERDVQADLVAAKAQAAIEARRSKP